MELSKLSPPKGSRCRKTRVGRGEGSGLGKTAGRGGKGQKGRKGATIRAGFEGGQMPLYRRLPKMGFTSRRQVLGLNQYELFNLDSLEKLNADTEVTAALLLGSATSNRKVKILGDGQLSKKLSVKVHAVSASARAKIEAAGGRVELLTRPQAHVSEK